MASPDTEKIDEMHRWFAVECNNRAWTLAEQEARIEAEKREMILAAEAAAYHWSQVGTPLHNARADLLRAEAYLLAERWEEANDLTKTCVAYFEGKDDCVWDLTLALLQAGMVAASRGEVASARDRYDRAKSHLDAMTDADRASLEPYEARLRARLT